MKTYEETVVVDQEQTEVVLTAFGFYARCKSCPWVSEFTPAKHVARQAGIAHPSNCLHPQGQR